ncbi:putative G-protein coupled receptor 132 [Carettochelys insculpta]|uniref:putative G-protein coupled receptor 132 n=1 Tax=Carettochelys insculpta TaxID=44489 RepID=UPI003EB93BCD
MNGSGNETECCQSIPFENSRIQLVAIYCTVFAIGLPSNCLTTWLTFSQIRRKNTLAIYLFSLSLCEIMYLSTLPLWIMYVQKQHRWEMGTMACRLTGYVFFCNIYISILLLCCISIDRYVAVAYALECKGVRDQRKAMFITCILFSAVFIIHCPTFILPDGQQTLGCATCFETLPLNWTLVYFSIARFIIGFTIPCTILIFTNYKIFQTVEASCSLNSRQKRKAKCLAVAVITIFLICFGPFHLVLLIRAINFILHHHDTCSFEHRIYSTSATVLCIATANSIADPIIYVLTSENVRKDFSRSLREWRYQSTLSSRVESFKLKNSKESEETVETLENKNGQ